MPDAFSRLLPDNKLFVVDRGSDKLLPRSKISLPFSVLTTKAQFSTYLNHPRPSSPDPPPPPSTAVSRASSTCCTLASSAPRVAPASCRSRRSSTRTTSTGTSARTGERRRALGARRVAAGTTTSPAGCSTRKWKRLMIGVSWTWDEPGRVVEDCRKIEIRLERSSG